MSVPDTVITVSDGALGQTPTVASGGRLLIGPATLGGGYAVNTVKTFYTLEDVSTYLVSGPLADAVAHQLVIGGGPVHTVAATKTAATASSVTLVGTSPVSTVTVTSAVDSFDVIITIVASGTLSNMTFNYSLDNGNTVSSTITSQSGTPWAYTLLDPKGASTGVVFNFAAGSYAANDTFTFRVFAPSVSSANFQTAFDVARANTTINWSLFYLVGCGHATTSDETNLTTAASVASDVETRMGYAFGEFRYARAIVETPDIYAGGYWTSAWDTLYLSKFAGVTGTRTGTCVGHIDVKSPLNGLVKRRNSAIIATAMEGALIVLGEEHRDIGCVGNPGAAPGVLKLWRDEAVMSTKMYDNRAIAMLTRRGKNGFFFAGSPMLTSGTSDFKFLPNAMVIDKVCYKTRELMADYINSFVNVNANGTIYEADAVQIENAISGPLLDYVSGQISPPSPDYPVVTINRTNNITSTGILAVKVRVTPKGYARTITINIGFNNVLTTSAS